jgi:hypothetical protein
MTRMIVCDTGPLLHLSEAGAVHLLSMAGRVLIPPLEIISKGVLSQSAEPEHSTSKLKKRQIVFGFLFVTDQQTATFG